MNQQERLNYLVESFKEDSGEYRNLQVGDSEEEKRTVLRSLMNIRMPGSISETVLKIQNEFLTEDAKEKETDMQKNSMEAVIHLQIKSQSGREISQDLR